MGIEPSTTLFPYTTLFRSKRGLGSGEQSGALVNLIEGVGADDARITLVTIHHRLGDGEKGLPRSEEHTSELQSRGHLVCLLLLEKKKAVSLYCMPVQWTSV